MGKNEQTKTRFHCTGVIYCRVVWTQTEWRFRILYWSLPFVCTVQLFAEKQQEQTVIELHHKADMDHKVTRGFFSPAVSKSPIHFPPWLIGNSKPIDCMDPNKLIWSWCVCVCTCTKCPIRLSHLYGIVKFPENSSRRSYCTSTCCCLHVFDSFTIWAPCILFSDIILKTKYYQWKSFTVKLKEAKLSRPPACFTHNCTVN